MPLRTPPLAATLLLLLACDHGFADPTRALADPPPEGVEHPVVIHTPQTLGKLTTPLASGNGEAAGIPCATCHAPGADGQAMATPDAKPAHEGLSTVHGDLSCASCHDPEDRTRLRLADGRKLDFGDALSLCQQCHGTQVRDYEHGAHGGMSGHWDHRQGPRLRNHCLDCHDAHAPAWSQYMPVLPPRDRFFAHGDADPTEAHP